MRSLSITLMLLFVMGVSSAVAKLSGVTVEKIHQMNNFCLVGNVTGGTVASEGLLVNFYTNIDSTLKGQTFYFVDQDQKSHTEVSNLRQRWYLTMRTYNAIANRPGGFLEFTFTENGRLRMFVELGLEFPLGLLSNGEFPRITYTKIIAPQYNKYGKLIEDKSVVENLALIGENIENVSFVNLIGEGPTQFQMDVSNYVKCLRNQVEQNELEP